VKKKGPIKEGCEADLVLFDYDRLRDTATYSNPNSLTEGIDYVFVNGEIVYQNKEFTGRYSGKMIRHHA
jgi:N-acyl-D-amino-acid deacylase